MLPAPSLAHACEEFEAAMLRGLLSEAGVGKRVLADPAADAGDAGSDDLSSSDDVVQSLFVDAMAAALARAGGIGIGRELARSLAR